MSNRKAKREKRKNDRIVSSAYRKYVIATVLQAVRVLGMALLFVYYLDIGFPLDERLAMFFIAEIALYSIGKPLDKLRYKTRKEFGYDENGMSKSFDDYQKLSRKEREAIDKERIADAERLLSSGELKKMTKRGSDDPQKDLKKLIGLPKVKQQVEEMSARMEFEKKKMKSRTDESNRISSMHMLFIGNPGTGKTTVARIMAGLLYQYGYISQNAYIETDGNSMRGFVQGETSKRTQMILSKAKGKVLFIDEAYAMFSGPDAQEAIATIVQHMENHRGEFVLILAGYKNEMKRLIDANSGFMSRFGYIVDFPDYNEQELGNIFMSMAQDNNLYVPAETLEKFQIRIGKEKQKKNFGNARTVRNVLDKALSKHALNLKKGNIGKNDTYKLCPEDIEMDTEETMF